MTVSRRMFLGGAAGLIALPLLPSLLPRAARAADDAPARLMFLFAPNGANMAQWRPTGFGRDFVFGPTLSQLEDIRDDVLVISGLSNPVADAPVTGHHLRGTSTMLTSTHLGTSVVSNGESADQVAARTLGATTPFRSLELAVEPSGPAIGTCEGGLPCVYSQHVAWTADGVPLPGLSSPRTTFNLLFGGSDALLTATEIERRKRYRLSVLDMVADQASALSQRAAVEDRARLDQYLTAVRTVETRIDALEACGGLGAAPGEAPLQELADVLLDLAVLAFQCDRTRVVTMMLGAATSELVYTFLGVRTPHHSLSHHQRLPDNLAKLALIDTFQVGRFARLVRKLKDVPEGGGTMLDHTLLMMSSDVSDGDLHNHDDMPVLVAGHLANAMGGGRHLDGTGETLAHLCTSMLQAGGVPITSFGEAAAGPLTGFAG